MVLVNTQLKAAASATAVILGCREMNFEVKWLIIRTDKVCASAEMGDTGQNDDQTDAGHGRRGRTTRPT